MTDFDRPITADQVETARIKVEILNPTVGKAWDERVTTREDHSIFHRSAWARVLAESYGHQPHFLSVSIGGIAAALVPLMEVSSWATGRRGVSLPFSDYAGPLWTKSDQADLVYKALLHFAAKRKWKHLEIRGSNVPPSAAVPFLVYDSHRLDLEQGIDAIWRGFHPSVRRAIAKAEASGIQITIERSGSAIETFYKLHERTRKRHGLPPQPFAFFRAIANNLIGTGLGEIVIAKLAGVPVAGAVFLRSGGHVVYKFGASDSEHWSLRPNHLIMWKAVAHFVPLGCKDLNFGRTSRSDEGLLRFKRSWGTITEPLPYYRHDVSAARWVDCSNRQESVKSSIIFRHLPVTINRLAGRLVYPHLD